MVYDLNENVVFIRVACVVEVYEAVGAAGEEGTWGKRVEF